MQYSTLPHKVNLLCGLTLGTQSGGGRVLMELIPCLLTLCLARELIGTPLISTQFLGRSPAICGQEVYDQHPFHAHI